MRRVAKAFKFLMYARFMITALDTNFLVYCAKQKIDFLSEIGRLCSEKMSMIAPMQVMDELEKLSKAKSRDSKYATLALHLLEKYKTEAKIQVENFTAEAADDALLELDKKGNAIATLDSGLRHRIRNAKIIVIRQFNHLEIE